MCIYEWGESVCKHEREQFNSQLNSKNLLIFHGLCELMSLQKETATFLKKKRFKHNHYAILYLNAFDNFLCVFFALPTCLTNVVAPAQDVGTTAINVCSY